MNAYLDLLRTRGVARIIAAQLVARFPGGMISLGFLIHIEKIFDSYGAAGLVLAATSVGQAISGPVTSRWMGRWGMRPVLILTTVVCAVALSVIALAQLELWAFMLVGLIAGAVRAHNIERVRQLLTAATQPRESERAEADNETETPPTARRCPCCGGRMIIIDTFEGARPAQSPSPTRIRIDTS